MKGKKTERRQQTHYHENMNDTTVTITCACLISFTFVSDVVFFFIVFFESLQECGRHKPIKRHRSDFPNRKMKRHASNPFRWIALESHVNVAIKIKVSLWISSIKRVTQTPTPCWYIIIIEYIATTWSFHFLSLTRKTLWKRTEDGEKRERKRKK